MGSNLQQQTDIKENVFPKGDISGTTIAVSCSGSVTAKDNQRPTFPCVRKQFNGVSTTHQH